MIVVTWGSATDTGVLRKTNQDAVLAEAPVFLVADGMGGHLGGEVASQMTVDLFRELLGRPTVRVDDVKTLVHEAHRSIRMRAAYDPTVSGMGTTAVGLAMVTENGEDFWLAFNVGDSRIYRLHQGLFTQITVDHSLVQTFVASGRIGPEEARTHPERHVVMQVLGIENDEFFDPDYWVFRPEPGERFVICSDGLSGELDDLVIGQYLAMQAEPHEIARRLVEAANAAGGRDNITVIVIDVAGLPEAAPTTTGPVRTVPQAPDTSPDLPPVPDVETGYLPAVPPPAPVSPLVPATPVPPAPVVPMPQAPLPPPLLPPATPPVPYGPPAQPAPDVDTNPIGPVRPAAPPPLRRPRRGRHADPYSPPE